MKTLAVGDQIYNHGDMANPSHFGKVITIRENARFGNQYEIRPDDYYEGRNQYTITAADVSLEYKGTGLTRIVLKSAYVAWRENQLDQLMNRRGSQC